MCIRDRNHAGDSRILYGNRGDKAQTVRTKEDAYDWDANEDLRIGRYSTASSFYTGLIDELAVWDVQLDPDAVTAIYNSGVPIDLNEDSGNYDNSGDLQGWWRMGDGTEGASGNTIHDMSGNGFDGTKSGSGGDNDTPQYSTDVPTGE